MLQFGSGHGGYTQNKIEFYIEGNWISKFHSNIFISFISWFAKPRVPECLARLGHGLGGIDALFAWTEFRGLTCQDLGSDCRGVSTCEYRRYSLSA